MEKTSAYTATGSASAGMSPMRTLGATAALVVTFIVLYIGFVFLRDQNPDTPRLLIAVVAIIWGVGGVALLYFVANMFVEYVHADFDFIVKVTAILVFVALFGLISGSSLAALRHQHPRAADRKG